MILVDRSAILAVCLVAASSRAFGFERWPFMKGSGFRCGGKSQSPIDITPVYARYQPMPRLQFHGYDVHLLNATAMISHETVHEIGLKDSPCYVTGGPLKGQYNLIDFHFHWGRKVSAGSEHTIDGQRYPLEMHLVHIQSSHATLGEASKSRNGICVLAILFDVATFDRVANKTVENAMKRLTDKFLKLSGQTRLTIADSGFSLLDLLPPQRDRYFAYDGSLTTPPCSESVRWIVFDETLPIRTNLLSHFHQLKDETGSSLARNWRPTQSLNKRVVIRSFRVGSADERQRE